MKSCRMQPIKLGEKLCLCPLLLREFPPTPFAFCFLLTSVAFSQRKDSLQGHTFFFSHGEK